MKMPKVLDCDMTDCAYNRDGKCHALAITVGSSCPMCDTYVHSAQKGGVDEEIGEVGACRMDDCAANVDLECTAEGIHVKHHGKNPECANYKPR